MIKAIQFLGTQRSGSNLLRLILNEHNLISAPHPPHLLKIFVPLSQVYKENNLDISELVEDMCRWVEVNPVPWSGVNLSRAEILSQSNDVFDVFRCVYEQKAAADNASVWCSKSTFNIDYVDDIERDIKPFYIHLYRDGRDVACSFKKAVVGPKHIYHLAVKWKEEQEKSASFLAKLPEHRYHRLSYESLIESPEESIVSLCDKMGIPFQSQMLKYYDSEESLHTAESGKMWANVVKPPIRDNKDKFLSQLSIQEIEMFEFIAGKQLQEIGYKSVSQNNLKPSIDIDLFDKEDQLLRSKSKASAGSNDKSKRQAQENLLKEIHQKLGIKG